MRRLLAQGEVVVVETETDRYLGTVEIRDGTLVVRSGYAGRPVVLDPGDVVSIAPAIDRASVG